VVTAEQAERTLSPGAGAWWSTRHAEPEQRPPRTLTREACWSPAHY